jgi:sigma-54 dependent transcriptional regulator, acetoin dehydrogenase operon transcriptional activator AcoR
MDKKSHAEKVRSAVMLSSGPPEMLPNPIVDSWRRCLDQYGLEPHRVPQTSIVTDLELREICCSADGLLGAARSEVERLSGRLVRHDYVVTLHDWNSILLLGYSPHSHLEGKARSSRLLPGSVWSEESQGTNGVGTCIKQCRPTVIVGDEHFSNRLTHMTCVVAPIFDSQDGLRGALNVTTWREPSREALLMVQNMLGASARLIENLYFDRRHAGARLLRVSRQQDFADMSSEFRLVLDADDRIIDASQGIFRLLNVSADTVTGRDFHDVIDLGGRDRLSCRADSVLRGTSSGGSAIFLKWPDAGPAGSGKMAVPSAPASRRTQAKADDLDPLMAEQIRIAQRLVNRRLPVMLQGETGTGKSVLAKILHESSTHSSAPLVSINCAAIPKDLIESEMFGYRSGAFTGASKTGSKGRILEANGGTLFLDEVGDMSMELQTRLLQVLSDGEFVPIGGVSPVHVVLSVISASLQDVPSLVRRGRFRQDLYFRLTGSTITMSPLRNRVDREVLIQRVFAEEAAAAGMSEMRLDGVTLRFLVHYPWPGNLRELRNCCRYAVAVSDDNVITCAQLPAHMAEGVNFASEDIAQRVLLLTLQQNAWNVSVAAKRLGISRATLHRRIKAFKLDRHSPRVNATSFLPEH